MSETAIASGFADPGRDSQAVFRAAMMAMARPGTICKLPVALDAPAPLAPGTAALALALCDFETPIWLDPALATEADVAGFLKFHTGAPIVVHPNEAAFALVAGANEMPALHRFAPGSLEFPDRSTTLFVQVETLRKDGGWRLSGPGIAGRAHLSAAPLPPTFFEELKANHAVFPRGVDIYFVAGHRIAALPRAILIDS